MNPFTYNPTQSGGQSGGDTELQQLAKTDRNPVQESRYQQLLSGQSGGAAGGNPLVAQAQQLNQYYQTANQPTIGALGSQIPKIQDQYTQLVNSIKGNQQVAANSATLNANNEFARRGVSGGGAYDSGLAGAVLPVNAAYSGQLAQAGAGSVGDINNIALQIAQLQSGNPSAAVGNALSYGGLVNSTNALAQQQFLGTYQSPFTQSQTAYQLALANSINGGNFSGLASLAKQLGG